METGSGCPHDSHPADAVFISREVHPNTNSQVSNTGECERSVLLSTHAPLMGRRERRGRGKVKGQPSRDYRHLGQRGFEWPLLSWTG